MKKITVKLKVKRLWLVNLAAYSTYPLVFFGLMSPDQAIRFAAKFLKVYVE